MKMAYGLSMVLLLVLVGCQKPENSGTQSQAPATTAGEPSQVAPGGTTEGSASGGDVTLPSGLKYQDLKVGDGALAESGQQVLVHYTGWLTDGTKFDSSLDRGQPFGFRIGAGNVIQGWDQGVLGMRVGGKRKLTIPPDLGYGERGSSGVIPPNATLVFDVELVSIQ